jgi:hypothetical protein
MVKRLIFGVLLAAALVFAQEGGEGGMGGMGGGGSRGGGGDMGAPAPRMMPTPMERIATMFTLNKDQKKQVKGILDDGQKEALPVRDQMLKGRLSIAQAVAAGKTQDEIDAAIKAYAATQIQMVQIESRAFSKVYLALDKEQQAKVGPLLAMMNGLFKNKNWDTNLAGPN